MDNLSGGLIENSQCISYLHFLFLCDRTYLGEVDVYGYDYDYTLASYKKGVGSGSTYWVPHTYIVPPTQVEYLIHDIAKKHLVNKYGYPDTIGQLVYDPSFPIRGQTFRL